MRQQLGANPSVTKDAVTKGYVDTAIAAAVATGLPYDLSYLVTIGTRAVGLGDNTLGIKLQRAASFSSVAVRFATADASGSTVVELRKNGSSVSGTATTITATATSGTTTAGPWAFAAGDILTVYITSVGTTPGTGLVVDIKGVTA